MYYIVVISHIIFIEQNFKGNACCLQSFCWKARSLLLLVKAANLTIPVKIDTKLTS
jgi:hypothetical protein